VIIWVSLFLHVAFLVFVVVFAPTNGWQLLFVILSIAAGFAVAIAGLVGIEQCKKTCASLEFQPQFVEAGEDYQL